MGGVLVILALLAGFAVPAPGPLASLAPPARGPLLETTNHPEWKQFLVQAAYQRASEIDRLRDLPNMPTIAPIAEPPSAAPPPPLSVNDAVAGLPTAPAETEPTDVTGTIDEVPGGAIPVEIGEASSTELPLREYELQPPVTQPATLKRQDQSQGKPPGRARKTAKARGRPPAQPETAQDFFSALFSKPTATTGRTASSPVSAK